MLNPITNQRELAYIVEIDEVFDIEGVKNQVARVGGWTVFIKRDEFHAGDLAVYFEIDSKVPPIECFDFLSKYNYRIKTQKFVKGLVISQGLLMHPKDLGLSNYEKGDFLTEKLGVTYYEPEDNIRKADLKEALEKKVEKTFNKWCLKHPILSKIKFISKIKKNLIHKKYFNKKTKKASGWPAWVVKTDEERCQNLPYLFPGNDDIWIATEKIDGTSSTYTMRRENSLKNKKSIFSKFKKKKNIFLVCSRNVVFDSPSKKCYYDTTTNDGNVYLEMAKKYNIEAFCENVLNQCPNIDYINIQGETYGGNIQKRDYGSEHRLAVFNVILGYNTGEVVRLNPLVMKEFLEEDFKLDFGEYHLEAVPIVYKKFNLPATCDELLQIATGDSLIDGKPREGLVFRSLDGKRSFKAVSNEFLLKYHN